MKLLYTNMIFENIPFEWHLAANRTHHNSMLLALWQPVINHESDDNTIVKIWNQFKTRNVEFYKQLRSMLTYMTIENQTPIPRFVTRNPNELWMEIVEIIHQYNYNDNYNISKYMEQYRIN